MNLNRTLKRLLLGISAALLLAVAVLHGLGAESLGSELGQAGLGEFIVGAFRAVWLGFSATAIVLASIFALAALQPDRVAAWVLVALTLIPLISALLIYANVGPFFGAHMLLVAAVTGAGGALLQADVPVET